MSNSIQHCGILILAAGQSKRLGQPKQLLKFEGKTFINRLIDIVKEAGDFSVTLVLGSNAQKIKDQLTDSNLTVVVNEDWEEGMASSIKVGLESILQENSAIDGVMILVCDQPFITKESIQHLLKLQQSTMQPVAACYYTGVLGTPALFHKEIFPELFALNGDTGAKKIISKKAEEVAKLHFEKGILDIDTQEDYQNLIK